MSFIEGLINYLIQSLDDLVSPMLQPIFEYIEQNADNPIVMMAIAMLTIIPIPLAILILVLWIISLNKKIKKNIISERRKNALLEAYIGGLICDILIGVIIGLFTSIVGFVVVGYIWALLENLSYRSEYKEEQEEIAEEIKFIEDNYNILVNQELSNEFRNYLRTGSFNSFDSTSSEYKRDLIFQLQWHKNALDYDEPNYNYNTKYGTVKKIYVHTYLYGEISELPKPKNGIQITNDGFYLKKGRIYSKEEGLSKFVYFIYAYIQL